MDIIDLAIVGIIIAIILIVSSWGYIIIKYGW